MTYAQRSLDVITLSNAAAHYAESFKHADRKSPAGNFVDGPRYVVQDLYNAAFKDEHQFLLERLLALLDPADVPKFRRMASHVFEPRRDDVLEQELAERLAIRPDGTHIPGKIGRVEVGRRTVGFNEKRLEIRLPRTWRDRVLFRQGKLAGVRVFPKRQTWPVYAGEIEERNAESGVADPLPEGAYTWPEQWLLSNNPRISAEAAIAACDAIVDLLDEGSTAATIRGRTGTQPADPDATEDGTLLFTLTMSDPAFNAAADADPGGQAAADTITDDSSADATGTLTYCRMGATGTGADDHIDGEAGTSGSDFNFNTVSIVTGAVVSMSSCTVTVPQS
jgi:hypothetical protein